MKRRYVVIATWDDGSTEQVDVDATSANAARVDAEAVLGSDYDPGWMLVEVDGPMVAWY